jgi:hypothetical protein
VATIKKPCFDKKYKKSNKETVEAYYNKSSFARIEGKISTVNF